MAVVLDATISSPTANSYIDVATADGLVPLVVSKARADAWAAYTADQKAVYLIRSVKMIETYVDFEGIRVSDYQPLAWPRHFVFGPDRGFAYQFSEYPSPLQEAQALMAVNLGEGYDQEDASQPALQRLQVSTVRLQFDVPTGARSALLLPAEVVEKLRGFGWYVGSSGYARSIPVVR